MDNNIEMSLSTKKCTLTSTTILNKDKKRELLINKFIEKCPKVKLESIIDINKYYNTHKNNIDSDIKIDKIIFEYITTN